MKLTYEELNNDQLIAALTRLSREKLPVRVGWNIQRIMKKIEKEVKEGREIYIQLLKDTCEVDEKGELVFQKTPDIKNEDGTIEPGRPIPGQYIVKDADEFKRRTEEFMKLEVEINSHYILLKDLETINMSAADLMALAPLISELEVVQ